MSHTRVVAAVDDSPTTPAVARAAAVEARRLGLPLEVVHVVDHHHQVLDPLEDSALWRAAQAIGEAVPGDDVALRQLGGPPPEMLVEHTRDAALLALGSSHRGGVTEAVLGSTVAGVLRAARVPVLVVPEPATLHADDDRPVVAALGLDGDQEPVVRAAVAEALARGVGLRVVHSCRPADYAFTFGPGAPVAWHALEARARLEIDRVLLHTPGADQVVVHVTVAAAAPVDLVTSAARTAGLVVVGNRAHHGPVAPAHHLARTVLHHIDVPLLAVPVPTPAEVPARETARVATDASPAGSRA